MTELMKPIIKLFAGALFLLLVAAFSLGVGVWLGAKDRQLPRVRSLAPTVTQLETIGKLSATRVHVADVLSAEGYRGAWLILRDAAMNHAQQLIESADGSERNLTHARVQTELLIHQMYDLVD